MRRLMLPIYGLDQLVTIAIFYIVVLLLFWAIGLRGPLVLGGLIGAQNGFVVTIWRSAPFCLALPAEDEPAVSALLDGSPFIRRADRSNEWVSIRSRFLRWNSDAIRLRSTPNGLLVTGRRTDLTVIASHMNTLHSQ